MNYIKEVGRFKLPNNIDTPNKHITYYYGSKINEIFFKKVSKFITKNYKNSTVICLQGKGHCEDVNGVLYNDPMSLYPWVVKNPQNGNLDSTREKEIRILYSPYDHEEFNNGIINENIKEINNFYGLNVNYDQINLTLDKIIIGANCNPKLIYKIEDICIEKRIELAHQNL